MWNGFSFVPFPPQLAPGFPCPSPSNAPGLLPFPSLGGLGTNLGQSQPFFYPQISHASLLQGFPQQLQSNTNVAANVTSNVTSNVTPAVSRAYSDAPVVYDGVVRGLDAVAFYSRFYANRDRIRNLDEPCSSSSFTIPPDPGKAQPITCRNSPAECSHKDTPDSPIELSDKDTPDSPIDQPRSQVVIVRDIPVSPPETVISDMAASNSDRKRKISDRDTDMDTQKRLSLDTEDVSILNATQISGSHFNPIMLDDDDEDDVMCVSGPELEVLEVNPDTVSDVKLVAVMSASPRSPLTLACSPAQAARACALPGTAQKASFSTSPPPSADNTDSEEIQDRKLAKHLLQRPYEYTRLGNQHHRKKYYQPNLMTLKVASYNILSQDLLENNSYLYRHCTDEQLSWPFRRSRLLKEITHHKPDVLCLQEVYAEHFQEFFKVELKKIGYEGIYKKKTGHKNDGCAIFYLPAKLVLLETIPVEYYHPGAESLDRDNVGLVAVFSHTKKQFKATRLVVATTHLLFNPKRGDVKLAQLMVLLAAVDHAAYRSTVGSPTDPSYHPVILCGDFNTEPSGPLYSFLQNGYVQYAGMSRKRLAGHREGEGGGGLVDMERELVPPELGYTDNCQKLALVKERLKQSVACSSRSSRLTPHSGSASLEEGEVMSDEGATSGRRRGMHPAADEMCCDDPAIVAASFSPPSPSNHSPAARPPTEDITPEELTLQGSGELCHFLRLQSVYLHTRDTEKSTSHHRRFNGTVDYIFYSTLKKRSEHVEEGALKLLGCLKLPTEKLMHELGPLPNNLISSDHILCMAKFLWTLKK